ncbi:hypothetical protein [Costertonia aggregata]|uniref:Uncharacterized protein n=1 Tax=Costertonia aggregata TaxID=343403 RepID=A0A7H9AQ95_9FLAO|nr:hypothetical protein [Costertonia aggregata]QLG45606.1 hypothetical protein HYG79_09685 [Costertonia aggregata]
MKKLFCLFTFFTIMIAFQNQAYSQVLAVAGSEKEATYGNGSGCLICELERFFAEHMGWGTSNASGSWREEKEARRLGLNNNPPSRDIHGRPIVDKAYLESLSYAERNRIKKNIDKEEEKCGCILIPN